MTDFKVGDKVEVVTYPDKTPSVQPGMAGVVMISDHNYPYVHVQLENDIKRWFTPEELKLVDGADSGSTAISVEAVYRLKIRGQVFELSYDEAESLSGQVFAELYRVEEGK